MAIDCSTSSPSIDLPSPKLELPTPERLLDGGEVAAEDITKEQRTIMDRVWEAFGGWNNNEHKVDGNDNNNFIACLFMSTHYTFRILCVVFVCFAFIYGAFGGRRA